MVGSVARCFNRDNVGGGNVEYCFWLRLKFDTRKSSGKFSSSSPLYSFVDVVLYVLSRWNQTDWKNMLQKIDNKWLTYLQIIKWYICTSDCVSTKRIQIPPNGSYRSVSANEHLTTRDNLEGHLTQTTTPGCEGKGGGGGVNDLLTLYRYMLQYLYV